MEGWNTKNKFSEKFLKNRLYLLGNKTLLWKNY